MKPASPYKIAVIGGGASAALLLAAMPAGNVSFDVYDRSGRFARGVAYSTRQNSHLLNVRAANMSGYQADKDHFAQWASKHGYNNHDFVPRRLYGDYLQSLFDSASAKFDVQTLEEDVVSTQRTGNGFIVNDRPYNDVILATGNVAPLAPRADGIIANYHPDPWALTRADVVDARSIGLVGTGLTAVDTLLTLNALEYAGNVTMISRRTLLPASHSEPAAWPHSPLTADDADKPLSHLLGMVRMHVRAAADQDIPWQAVIDSLRPVTNLLWQGFTDLQRQRFKKHLLTLWNIHRHRMAPSIAAQVEEMKAQGRLHFMRDAVMEIVPGPLVKGRQGNYAFDAVINCMGYGYEEPDRSYEYSYAIGPAHFGPLFETTAIPEIRAQAHDIARQISQRAGA